MRDLIDDDRGSGPPPGKATHPASQAPHSLRPGPGQAISEKNQKAIKTLHNRNVQKLIFANASSQS